VTAGSGNVFADLGLPEPEEEWTKAQLASHIRQAIERQRLTQIAAAGLMGIGQPKVSAILNGRLANFSSERLMRLLTTLGQDVEITIRAKPRSRPRGRIRVVAEAHAKRGGAGVSPVLGRPVPNNRFRLMAEFSGLKYRTCLGAANGRHLTPRFGPKPNRSQQKSRLAAALHFRWGDAAQKSMPPMPPPGMAGIAGLSFGTSATIASVVTSRPAIDEASCNAARTTLAGSMMPFSTMST
jgi:predicted XRE-type DNA-binding protein